jgi:hypothetical protein
MASQRTGTQILQYARYLSGDNDTNLGVDATYALELLNDILHVWADSIVNRPTRISATTSGLTFTAGTVYKEVTAGVDCASFKSVHQSNTASILTPLSPALEYVKPEEMLLMIDDDGSGSAATLKQQSGDWSYWSFEKTADVQDRYRVFVWPPLSRTVYLTAVAPVQLELAAIGNTPDVSPVHARYISRILAWEIARHNEMPESWCDRILSRVPEEIQSPFLGRAVRVTQQAGTVVSVED